MVLCAHMKVSQSLSIGSRRAQTSEWTRSFERRPEARSKPYPFAHRAQMHASEVSLLRFLSQAPVFRAFPPPPPLLLFALDLPCRMAAVADALLGMVNSDFLLLLLLLAQAEGE
jgi:hypothetical protein